MQRVDADRSRGRRRTCSTGTRSSRRYVGATPLTHFHAITADLKVTHRRCLRRSGVELLSHCPHFLSLGKNGLTFMAGHGIFYLSSVSETVKCKQQRFFQRYHMSTNTLCMLFGDKATAVMNSGIRI